MAGPHSRRRDHPYRVERLSDLPDGLRQLAEQAPASAEPMDTIVVMPAQLLPVNFQGKGGAHMVAQRALLFTARGVLYVQDGAPGQAAYLRGDQILSTRLTLILLYGRLEFCGVEGDSLKRIVVEYNAARHDLLEAALRRFLRLAWAQPAAAPEPGEDRTSALLQTLGEQSFKFGSGLRLYALPPGERLLDYVYQPRVVRRLLGIFPRLAAPAALLAVTGNEILLIEEGRTNPTSYGWFITFCPRACVTGVETRAVGEWQEAVVHLKRGALTADHALTLGPAAVCPKP